MMRMITLAVIMGALLGGADKKAEDAATKAQDAAAKAQAAVHEAVVSRAKSNREAAATALRAATTAQVAADVASERTAFLEQSLADITTQLKTAKDSQSTERLKSYLLLAGVVISSLIGSWGINRTGKMKQDLVTYKQEIDGRFTKYAELIKVAAHAEGKLEGEALVREVHRMDQMNRSGG